MSCPPDGGGSGLRASGRSAGEKGLDFVPQTGLLGGGLLLGSSAPPAPGWGRKPPHATASLPSRVRVRDWCPLLVGRGGVVGVLRGEGKGLRSWRWAGCPSTPPPPPGPPGAGRRGCGTVVCGSPGIGALLHGGGVQGHLIDHLVGHQHLAVPVQNLAPGGLHSLGLDNFILGLLVVVLSVVDLQIIQGGAHCGEHHRQQHHHRHTRR